MSLKPYPEYKDSGVAWLGKVPEHWERRPLFSLVRELDDRNEGVKEDNLLSLSYGQIKRKDINDNDGLLPASFETYQIVEKDDIVWRLTDLQNDQRSLRTGLARERGIITSAYLATRPTAIQPSFLAYLLRAYDQVKVFYSMGGGLRQSMKFSDVKWLPIMLPPSDEQTTIVAFLDSETAKIDDLIAEQEKLITLLAEKRRATISHAVTKGLNPDAPMKASGIEWLGDIPAHWVLTRLKFVAEVQGGIAKGKDYGGQKTISVPFLRVANVQDGYLDLDDMAQIDIPPEDAVRYRLQRGDVLMNEGGDYDKLGRGHIWNDEIPDCVHQNHVFAVRPSKISSEFLNRVTSSAVGQFYFMTRSKQSTNLASISSSNIMELPLALPSAGEAKDICDFIDCELNKLDALSSEADRVIDLLKERRSALISAAVTGKIDVRGAMGAQEAA